MACYYFKLIPETGPSLYLDDEPIKWSDVQIIGKRDPDWHGFNYEYTDGDILLEFDCLAGKDFIDEIYNEQGVDGLILLQFGKYNGITEILEYEGKLNLATFRRLKYRVSCSIEKTGLHDLVKSRWTTKVDLFSSNTIDGDPITRVAPLDLEMHSKSLINNFTKKTGVEGSTIYQTFSGQIHDIFFTLNTLPDNADDSNIDATPGTSLGVSELNPTQFSKYVFDLNAAGSFTFNITLDYIYNIKLMKKKISSTPKIGNWSLYHYLHVIDLNGNTKVKKSFGGYSGFSTSIELVWDNGSQPANALLQDYKIDLASGDKVYIYSHFSFDGYNAGWKGVQSYIQSYSSKFDIIAETSAPPTLCKAFPIHETLEAILKITTGDDSELYSDLLGRENLGYPLNGCGAMNMVTNGFQLRNFDIANKSPQLSLKDALTSIDSLYCVGMAYTGNTMRLEKREFFYQDREILFIPEVSDYEEKVATDLIYNNIQIGYAKYLDEGIKLLDEFNTQHEYLSPIKRHDNKLTQLSTLIGSGYAIETTRRAIFADTQKDSTKYDDDCFIIAVKRDATVTGNVTFRTNYFNPGFSTALKFNRNNFITISGSTNNDGVYRITSTFFSRIYLDRPLVSGTEVVTITNNSIPYRTEKNESFEVVSGVVSPSTCYNLRHSPKRMLMRWAKWLNGGFYYKSSGDVIKNTFAKQNGELTTKFNSAETCNLGDPQKDLIIEKDDISLAEFDEFDMYYIPEWCTFKARMTIDEINQIKDAMTGQSIDKDYGFIRSIMPNGNHLESWIYEMAYNPNTEQVTFTTLKKRVIIVSGPTPLLCSDFTDITVGEAEALPIASQNFIERCRFDNFTI